MRATTPCGTSSWTFIDTNAPGGPFTGTNNAGFSSLTVTQTGSTLTYSGTLISDLTNTHPLANTRYLVTLPALSSDGTYWGSYYMYLTTDNTGQVSFTSPPFQAPSGFTTAMQGNLATHATANPPHSLGNFDH
jgi:hypothetical protein